MKIHERNLIGIRHEIRSRVMTRAIQDHSWYGKYDKYPIPNDDSPQKTLIYTLGTGVADWGIIMR